MPQNGQRHTCGSGSGVGSLCVTGFELAGDADLLSDSSSSLANNAAHNRFPLVMALDAGAASAGLGVGTGGLGLGGGAE